MRNIVYFALVSSMINLIYFFRMWDDKNEDPNFTHFYKFESSNFTYIKVEKPSLIARFFDSMESFITR